MNESNETDKLDVASILRGDVCKILDVKMYYKDGIFVVESDVGRREAKSYENAVIIFDELLQYSYLFDWDNYEIEYDAALGQISAYGEKDIVSLFEVMSTTEDYEMALAIKDAILDYFKLPENTILTWELIMKLTNSM